MDKNRYIFEIQKIQYTETSAEGDSLDLEIGTVYAANDNDQLSFVTTLDYLSLKVTKGSDEYGVNWGKASDMEPAFRLYVSDAHYGGSGLIVLTKAINVKIYNIEI